MIVSFDPTTAFGCKRRWFFKYVEKRPEPQTGNQELGTALHAANEAYLKTGIVPSMSPQVESLFNLGRSTLDRLRPSIKKVEEPVSFEVCGIPLRGYCDLVTQDGIWDWKTTSSIESYGKTPGQLAKDTQLILYALAEHPQADVVTLAHGQYQTKGRPAFRESKVEISNKRLAEHNETVIIPLVESMVLTAKETESRAVPANRNACRMCPHRGYCPQDSENPIMSFFSKYKNAPVAAPTHAQVLPPDAPVPAPEVTVPVPAPSPAAPAPVPSPPPAPAPQAHAPATMTVEEAQAIVAKFSGKRGRRPAEFYAAQEVLGQFNGPAAPAPAPSPVVPPAAVKPPAPLPQAPLDAPVSYESVNVSYGVTVNMGNFNSIRIDVSLGAKCPDGNVTAIYEAVLAQVKAKVEAEVAKLPAPSGK